MKLFKYVSVAMFGGIMAASVSLSVSAQQFRGNNPKQAPVHENISKILLYTLGPNEEPYFYEFASNMKFSKFHFWFLTYDKVNNKKSLISDAKKLVTSNEILVFDMDYPNPNPLSYYYSDGGQYYVSSRGQVAGPYDEVTVFWSDDNNRYRYYKDEVWTRHEPDGTEMREDIPIYKSRSGRSTATFSDDKRSVTFNDNTYSIPLPYNISDIKVYETVVLDSGEFLFSLGYKDEDDFYYSSFLINKNTIRDIGDESSGPKYSFHELMKNVKRINKAKPFIEEPVDVTNVTFNDKEGNSHNFNCNWDWNYVILDGTKYKCEPPLHHFFDEETNSFCWVSLEGKKLLLYSCRL